jgi:hypothetical protein
MKRNDTRPLHVNDQCWEYKIGKKHVAIYDDQNNRHYPTIEQIVGKEDFKHKNFQLNPAIIKAYIYNHIIPNDQPHICHWCREKSTRVKLRYDPFDAEINETNIQRYMCPDCRDDREQEV